MCRESSPKPYPLHYLPYTTRLSSLNNLSRRHLDLYALSSRTLHHHTNCVSSLHFPRPASITRGYPFTLSKPPARLSPANFRFFLMICEMFKQNWDDFRVDDSCKFIMPAEKLRRGNIETTRWCTCSQDCKLLNKSIFEKNRKLLIVLSRHCMNT